MKEQPEASIRSAARALTALAALAAAWVVADSLHMAWTGHAHAFRPGWIYLDGLWRWQTGRMSLKAALFEPVNQNRPPVTMLILLADWTLFRLGGIFPVVCLWLFQTAHAFVWRAACRRAATRPADRVALGALIIGALFCAQQWQNLLHPVQACSTAVAAFAAGAILLFTDACRGRGARAGGLSAAALLCAALASGSLANGLLVWPLLALIGILEGASRRKLLPVFALGAVVFYAYYGGASGVPGGARRFLSQQPFDVLGFLGAFLFQPFVFLSDPTASALAGLAGLLSAGVLAVAYGLARRRGAGASCSYFVYMLLFCSGTAVLVALGRAHLTPQHVRVSRYQTWVYLYWACWAALASLFWRRNAGRSGALAAPALSAAFLAVVVLRQSAGAVWGLTAFHSDADIRSALAAGVLDAPMRDLLFEEEIAGEAQDLVSFLKQRRLSVFDEPLVQAVGKPLDAAAPARSTECSGAFDRAEPVSGAAGWRVSGTAWETRSHRPLDAVLIVDDRSGVAGVAYPDQTPSRVFSSYAPSPGAWSGYAAASKTARFLEAYGLTGDGKSACLLGRLSPPSASRASR